MKRIVFVFALMIPCLVPVFGGGIRDMMVMDLVNVQEIELDQIESIEVRYQFENVTLFNSNSNTLIIKEYMSKDDSRYYAEITNSGNKLVVEAGRRPLGINTFRARIEVYIPASDKNITIRTSSGRIQADGEYTASSMNIENSSGSISVKAITADRINLRASSGSIHCRNANGNTTVNTSSGSIKLDQVSGSLTAGASSGSIQIGTVSGNASLRTTSGSIVSGSIDGSAAVESSSGRINLGMVNGTIDAKASSGSIHCVAAESAGNISITTSSGSVTLEIPRNSAFNFSSRSTSGSLRTPFSDKLFSPFSDRNSVQGVVSNDDAETQIDKNINIRTTSGSIRINWTT